MGGSWRAFMLSEGYCIGPGGPAPAPADWWGGGVGELLNRLAPHYRDEGVLMLDEHAAQLLGLPHEGRLPDGGIDHPAIEDAARAGWKVSRIRDWSTFTRPDGGPALHMGIGPLLDLRTDKRGVCTDFPLWGPIWWDTVAALDLWHELTGTAWHGNPGIAGTSIQKTTWPRGGGKTIPPTAKPNKRCKDGTLYGPGDQAREDDLRMGHWARDPVEEWLHGFDWNRAYIAAAMLAELAPWSLKHTGRTAWNPRLAGWWLVELSPWNDPLLPHPAGYLDEARALVRWVTGPTMYLLDQLTKAGRYGGVNVLDSWTGPARDFCTRAMAERLRDAYAGISTVTGRPVSVDPLDLARVRGAVKQAGREVMGLWNRETNWVHRPDWWYGIVALSRCNQWRAIDREYQRSGRTPITVDVDNMWYESPEQDITRAAPITFTEPDRNGRTRWDPTGMQLGAVKPRKTRRRRRMLSAIANNEEEAA